MTKKHLICLLNSWSKSFLQSSKHQMSSKHLSTSRWWVLNLVLDIKAIGGEFLSRLLLGCKFGLELAPLCLIWNVSIWMCRKDRSQAVFSSPTDGDCVGSPSICSVSSAVPPGTEQCVPQTAADKPLHPIPKFVQERDQSKPLQTRLVSNGISLTEKLSNPNKPLLRQIRCLGATLSGRGRGAHDPTYPLNFHTWDVASALASCLFITWRGILDHVKKTFRRFTGV